LLYWIIVKFNYYQNIVNQKRYDIILKILLIGDIKMIDLHMHTQYSDGSKTVEEILKLCEERKLEYISITDHDNCKQYMDKAFNEKIFSGKIIKGSELRAVINNRRIEILAYNINTEVLNEWLEKYYSEEKLVENQKKTYKAILKILDKQGIIYNEENIRKPVKPTDFVERPIYEEIIKHKENHKILGEFTRSLGMFFRKGLTEPKSAFFMKPIGVPNYSEVINAIHNAGGKAFLAHPFEYKIEDTIGFIEDLRNTKELDGIECFHPSAEENNRSELLVKYAKENNLYISGGSDFHGKTKPDIQIGIGRGSLKIPKQLIEEWIY